LGSELGRLAKEAEGAVTLARTHLMDAVPTTYARTFDGWARRMHDAAQRVDAVSEDMVVLPLGGTAVGTGIGADAGTAARAVEILGRRVDLELQASANPATAIAAQEAPVAYGDALAGVARVLFALANDLRLRGSGPFGGLGELKLHAVQPGSSIMPGKVNPVIPEAAAQVALQVEGLASTCRASVALHQLDLSHANPLLAWNLDTMGTLLARACRVLVEKCLAGLRIDRDRCRSLAAASPAVATALARRIGYEKAAEVAKAAEAGGETVMEAARRLEILPETELEELLDLDRMAGEGEKAEGGRRKDEG
jgi:fumarate hydratase class II